MKIWVNTIVHNEENFIWFAIMSVVDHVDKVLIYDTGSTDKTVEIIKDIQKLKGDKIEFKEIGEVDKEEFTKARQEMLEHSDSDWILIVDGDEIWWEQSLKKVVDKIQKEGQKTEGIVVPMVVPVGDIYHLQEENAGQYSLLGRSGHLSLRVLSKKIQGLHVGRPYGKEGYFDGDNRLIQERKEIIFLDAPYLHLTHLKRSSRKNDKFKYELGKKVGKDFKFPEVLSKLTPKIVPSPWEKRSKLFWIISLPLTPLRKIKRRLK